MKSIDRILVGVIFVIAIFCLNSCKRKSSKVTIEPNINLAITFDSIIKDTSDSIITKTNTVSLSNVAMNSANQLKRQNDFSIFYHYSDEDIPPPSDYEYTITVGQNGKGKIIMITNYHSDTAPNWIESFTIKRDTMDRFYEKIRNQGFFSRKWQSDFDLVGAPYHSLLVTNGGRQTKMEGYFDITEKVEIKIIFDSVDELVPKTIWDQLYSKRREYIEEFIHNKKGH
jgi:hypothetical protein